MYPKSLSHILGTMLAATAALFATQPAHADDFAPMVMSEAPLANGSWIGQYAYEFDPGSSFPWHYHPGSVQIIVTAGTLTEDRGCGQPPEIHGPGTAFTEEPGVVHRVFNYGADPVVIQVSEILPACYGPDTGMFNDAILVDGPNCEGRSGRSRVERVACP